MGTMLFDGARHTVAQANIDAKRITQNSGNTKRAAISSLEAFNQSLSNKKILDAAGDKYNSIEENLGRALDQAAMGKLSSRISAAQQLGAVAADAAAAGVGGSSVEAYNQTMRLSQDISEEQSDRAVREGAYDAGQQAGSTVTNAVDSMGRDIFAPDLDFTQYVNDHKMGALTKIFGTAAAAAATYFGGPSAGMAVMSAVGADQSAKNGDYAGASAQLNSALSSGIQGFKTYRAGADGDNPGGQSWFSQITGKHNSGDALGFGYYDQPYAGDDYSRISLTNNSYRIM